MVGLGSLMNEKSARYLPLYPPWMSRYYPTRAEPCLRLGLGVLCFV